MTISSAFEFPPKQQHALRQARRLEWVTIGYLATVIVVMYLVMGSSQAMKTAWLEDLLGLVPPVVFLLASRIALWPPNDRFPYGYHRVVSIAFLCASLTLCLAGGWLLVNAAVKLVRAEHPTIGGVIVFGEVVWLGWLMMPALLWGALPTFFLGQAKRPLADSLHDKVLAADADMNKADWMTATAAMVGVIGIGFGLWWTDAAAAMLISLSILRDGLGNLRAVVTDLMDESPKSVDGQEMDPLPRRIEATLRNLPWVLDARVRLREEGHVYFGEATVVLSEGTELAEQLCEARRVCAELDWRLHDLVLAPVVALRDESADAEPVPSEKGA